MPRTFTKWWFLNPVEWIVAFLETLKEHPIQSIAATLFFVAGGAWLVLLIGQTVQHKRATTEAKNNTAHTIVEAVPAVTATPPSQTNPIKPPMHHNAQVHNHEKAPADLLAKNASPATAFSQVAGDRSVNVGPGAHLDAPVVTGDNNTLTLNPASGWRQFSSAEIQMASSYLHTVPGAYVTITVPMGDYNRMELAGQIRDIIAAAQWQPAQISPWMEFGDGKTPSPFPLDGVLIRAHDATPAAQHLLDVLGHLLGEQNVYSVKQSGLAVDRIDITVRSKKRR